MICYNIPHQLLHRVLAVEAVTAKDLHGVSSSLVGNITSKGLGDRSVVRVTVTYKITTPSNVTKETHLHPPDEQSATPSSERTQYYQTISTQEYAFASVTQWPYRRA